MVTNKWSSLTKPDEPTNERESGQPNKSILKNETHSRTLIPGYKERIWKRLQARIESENENK